MWFAWCMLYLPCFDDMQFVRVCASANAPVLVAAAERVCVGLLPVCDTTALRQVEAKSKAGGRRRKKAAKPSSSSSSKGGAAAGGSGGGREQRHSSPSKAHREGGVYADSAAQDGGVQQPQQPSPQQQQQQHGRSSATGGNQIVLSDPAAAFVLVATQDFVRVYSVGHAVAADRTTMRKVVMQGSLQFASAFMACGAPALACLLDMDGEVHLQVGVRACGPGGSINR